MATKAITSFAFANPPAVGVINEVTHTIAVTVPYGTVVTGLVPTITHTGTSVAPLSGAAQDFTLPVTYTVTASDATTQEYVVTVITSLTLLKQYLQIGADDVSRDSALMSMWNSAIETIENELGYKVSLHTVSLQVPGSSFIPLKGPVASGLVVKYRNDLTDTEGITDTTLTAWLDYYVFPRHIELHAYKTPEPRIIITYQSGWNTLPAPLENAARMLVAYQLQLTTTAQPGAFIDKRTPTDVEKCLEPYRVLELP